MYSSVFTITVLKLPGATVCTQWHSLSHTSQRIPECVCDSKMAASLLKYSYKGLEYAFVDAPVRLLEKAKCPVCLEIVRKPVSTSCNHLFCSDCIRRRPNCPTCHKKFTTTPDKGSVRALKAFKVKCPNSVEGCKWQGDFGEAEEHLEKKCQHQKVECPNGCWEKVDRKSLQNHVRNACLHRTFGCQYCHYEGMYYKVITTHYATCGDFPLSCPTGCGKKIKRRNMESHLSTECPEEYISCKYVMFGCDTAVKRREKETHFSDDTFHLKKSMEFQLVMTQSLSKCMMTKSWDPADVTSLPLSFRPWLQNTPTCYPHPPWVVKLEGFEEKKKNKERWHSDPVYSHFGGYKMCLRVYSSGHGEGKGAHLSLLICLMKGDNDDNLNFPFKGRIVVSLLNQLEDKNHLTKEPWSPEDNIAEDISERVTTGERGKGWGFLKFIPHNDLNYNSDKNCQYLKNDCIFLRVDSFQHTRDSVRSSSQQS